MKKNGEIIIFHRRDGIKIIIEIELGMTFIKLRCLDSLSSVAYSIYLLKIDTFSLNYLLLCYYEN